MSNISIQLSVDESQELSLYRDALLESLYEAELDVYHLSRQHKLALLELIAAINQAQDARCTEEFDDLDQCVKFDDRDTEETTKEPLDAHR